MTTEEHIRALREALEAGPTPGPWFDSRSERFPECYVRAANGQHIAAVPWSTENDGANAALIAAAHPEAIRAVLDALEAAQRDRALLYASATNALAAYQHRFGSVAPPIGNYTGPIDEQMAELRGTVAALTNTGA